MYDDPYYNEKECPECGCPCSVFDEICELCKNDNENDEPETDENYFL